MAPNDLQFHLPSNVGSRGQQPKEGGRDAAAALRLTDRFHVTSVSWVCPMVAPQWHNHLGKGVSAMLVCFSQSRIGMSIDTQINGSLFEENTFFKLEMIRT